MNIRTIKKGLKLSFKPFLLLFYQGSNLEFQDQNLTCYHYTIEQFLYRRVVCFSITGAKIQTFFKSANVSQKNFAKTNIFHFPLF